MAPVLQVRKEAKADVAGLVGSGASAVTERRGGGLRQGR